VMFQDICDWSRRFPTKAAAVRNGVPVSYAAFCNAIDCAKSVLKTKGLPPGKTVVVVEHDILDSWIIVLAAQSLGLNTVCVRGVDLVPELELTGVAGLLSIETGNPDSAAVSTSSAGIEPVIKIARPRYNTEVLPLLRPVEQGLKEGGHILYTSGTTGKYKKLFASGELQASRDAERIRQLGLGEHTRMHLLNYGLWTAAGYKLALSVWRAGGCVIFDQRPDWCVHFMGSGMTDAVLIPVLVDELIESLASDQSLSAPLDFKLHIGAGFVSRQSAEQLLRRVTTNVAIGYGSTEVSVLVLETVVDNLNDIHWLSPNGFRIVEVVDEIGEPCPVDVEGQVRIRLTDLDSTGYIGDDDATRKVFRGDYFYPGDMAIRRADGCIRILGRSADVINMRGNKIAVAPLEEKTREILRVNAVCLFGGLTDSGEEELVVVIEADRWPDKADLDYVGREFAHFDHVQFAIVSAFPRTTTGTSKINRVALRQLVYSHRDRPCAG